MPLIGPDKGYLRKYSPLTPLPLAPLRVPMTILLHKTPSTTTWELQTKQNGAFTVFAEVYGRVAALYRLLQKLIAFSCALWGF